MQTRQILPLLCATALSAPAWAENTAAVDNHSADFITSSDYVNTKETAVEEGKGISLFNDRFNITGTFRVRADGGDTNSSYAGQANQPHNTTSHLNADLWFSARIYNDWRVVTEIEPQIDLETGKFNGDHDVPMNKLYVEGTVYDKVKTRLGKFGAFSSYGRVLDNEVTGGELSFDYKIPTKVTVARVTKQMNDNPWGVEVRREMMGAVQSVFPINEKVNVGATAVYLNDVKRPNRAADSALFGEIGVDVKFDDDWSWMAAYSRSNINDVRDSAGKKVAQDGAFTELKFKNADWKTRNSYDVFFNLRRVGAMSGISSTNDYSKNVQGAQIGFDYVLLKNLKLNAFYLHGKQVNATVGNDKQNVRVIRGQLEYTF
ncbi:MAG: hypothetical protein Q4A84_04395 [Neisseria sp.]|uniref:hypothetical protein n=1 Tax=Neisseria sp. TaxID=192066 RepID=UPI0026DC0C40|nr:hypothetical protein [Neisseria sp.]MDO4640928.1 hypothetical protein [Neisseria sp.]